MILFLLLSRSFALSLLSTELPYYHCGHRVRESFYLHILTNLPDDSKSRCERTYPLHSDQMIQLTRIQFRMEKVHGHPIKCTTDFCILIFVTIVRFVVVHLFLWISWVDIPSCFFLVISIPSFFPATDFTAQCIQSEWSQTKQSSVKLIFFLPFVCRRKVWAITSHFFRSVVVSNHKIIWNATKRELRAFLKLQMSTSFVKTPMGQ